MAATPDRHVQEDAVTATANVIYWDARDAYADVDRGVTTTERVIDTVARAIAQASLSGGTVAVLPGDTPTRAVIVCVDGPGEATTIEGTTITRT